MFDIFKNKQHVNFNITYYLLWELKHVVRYAMFMRPIFFKKTGPWLLTFTITSYLLWEPESVVSYAMLMSPRKASPWLLRFRLAICIVD